MDRILRCLYHYLVKLRHFHEVCKYRLPYAVISYSITKFIHLEIPVYELSIGTTFGDILRGLCLIFGL